MSLDFSPPRRRPRGESVVPMINVVFLLLVFFLMTSRLAPPEPFEVRLPQAEQGEDGETAPVLYVSASGEIGFEDARGPAAVAALAERLRGSDAVPRLRADAGTEAAVVARLLKDLTAAGIAQVALVVGHR